MTADAALAGAAFGVVDADPVAAADDGVGADAFGAQRADRGIADRILRERGDVDALEPEQRQADGDVGFTAAEGGHQHRRLQQPLESRRTEPQHQLAERHDFGHQL